MTVYLTRIAPVVAVAALVVNGSDAGRVAAQAPANASQTEPAKPRFLTQPLVTRHLHRRPVGARVQRQDLHLSVARHRRRRARRTISAAISRCATTTCCRWTRIGGTVTDHGVALDIKDVPWAGRQMWAPDAAEKDGKYYLYFPAKDKQDVFRIGVAVGDKPGGSVQGASRSRSRAASASIRRCSRTTTASTTCTSAASGAGSCSAGRPGTYMPKDVYPANDQPALSAEGRAPRRRHGRLRRDAADVVLLDENGKPLAAGRQRPPLLRSVVDAQVQRHVLLLVLDRRHALHHVRDRQVAVRPVHRIAARSWSRCSAGRTTTRSSSSRGSGISSTTTRSSRAGRRTCATSR